MFPIKWIIPIAVILTIKNEETTALKILGIFPVPGSGHFTVAQSLMKELAKRGHKVDVVSHFPSDGSIPNYRDISLKGSIPMHVNSLTLGKLKRFNLTRSIDDNGMQICEILGHSSLKELMKVPKGSYDVLVIELFFAQCYLAFGQHLQAPIVGLVSSKLQDWLFDPLANPLNPAYIPSFFSSYSQEMTFWERLDNTLLTNFVRVKAPHDMNRQLALVEKHFGRKLFSINELYKDVSVVLVNQHFSINGIKPATPDIVDVGGLHVQDDDQKLTPELQKWLDESTHGCIYFTLGSMMKIESFPNETLNIFHETFSRIAPVRVLVKIVDEKALPKPFTKNVKTAAWLPQVAILKHKNVRAFITHGGLLGTQEAIVHRVPMIGIPLFGDQKTNVRSYEHLKIAIGLGVEELSRESFMSAVDSILKDPTYRENMDRVSKLFLERPMTAMDTAVYYIEYTARHGTVLKSPATELTWWQYHLIDVYGFILAVVLVALYSIKLILKFLWRLVRKITGRRISRSKKNN